MSPNTVLSYRQELGFKAVLAVKPVNTTVAIKEHKKYSYKLRGLDITYVNQVWSTDLTYIKTSHGMGYLAAIIDWYSKAVLSYKISNTMDTEIVMDVLNEALATYGPPEIFNTDQGSQYTSEIHTQRLNIQPTGKELLALLGTGNEKNNSDVVRSWLNSQNPTLDQCNASIVDMYAKKLALKLTDIQNYTDW